MTRADNVVVGAYVRARDGRRGARARRRRDRARRARARSRERLAGELTTKQLRLMELARALAGQPRLLLLDETLAGLGHGEVDEVLGVIRRLARAGHHRS